MVSITFESSRSHMADVCWDNGLVWSRGISGEHVNVSGGYCLTESQGFHVET